MVPCTWYLHLSSFFIPICFPAPSVLPGSLLSCTMQLSPLPHCCSSDSKKVIHKVTLMSNRKQDATVNASLPANQLRVCTDISLFALGNFSTDYWKSCICTKHLSQWSDCTCIASDYLYYIMLIGFFWQHPF